MRKHIIILSSIVVAHVLQCTQATVSALSSDAQASVGDLQAQLAQHRELINAASSTGDAALQRCEELRRQSTLHSQRLDSFTGYVKDAVKPIAARYDLLGLIMPEGWCAMFAMCW